MKRLFLLLSAVLSVLGIAAQDYKPMLVNGREWHVAKRSIFNSEVNHLVFSVGENVSVGGKSAVKINNNTDFIDDIIAYEDKSEKKVYTYDSSLEKFFYEFDLSLEGPEGTDAYGTKIVADSILVKGRKYRRITIDSYVGVDDDLSTLPPDIDYDKNSTPGKTVIVEGIGIKRGYYFADPNYELVLPTDGSYYYIEKVVDNGEVIFEKEDFDAPSISHDNSFVMDGNSWQYYHQIWDGGRINRELKTRGTSVIDGKTYVNLYDHEIGKDLGEPVAFVREENKVIYARGQYLSEYIGDGEGIVFDYNNVRNPESLWNKYSDYDFFTDFAVREDVGVYREAVSLDEGPRERIVISPKDSYEVGMEYGAAIFLDGVGFVGAPEYFTNLFLPSVATARVTGEDFDVFVSMTDPNGKVVYDATKTYQIEPIGGIDSVGIDSRSGVAGWYDLRGVRLAEKPSTAGIYIVRLTDGTAKKVVVR